MICLMIFRFDFKKSESWYDFQPISIIYIFLELFYDFLSFCFLLLCFFVTSIVLDDFFCVFSDIKNKKHLTK